MTPYKDLVTCIVKSGSSVLLWHDIWSDQALQLRLPHLYTFAHKDSISISEAKLLDNLADHFQLPLSEEAYDEFLLLQDLLDDLPISGEPDQWLAFGNATVFNVSRTYKIAIGQHITCPALKWIWKTCCLSKHKVFFWLLLQNRLNTRELLQRKSFFLPDYTCVLCHLRHLETRNHLFFECPFAVLCWQYLLPSWSVPNVDNLTPVISFIDSLKSCIGQPFSMEIITLVCWAIWRTRNDFVFNKVTPSVYRTRRILKDDLAMLLHKAKRKSYGGLKDWISWHL